MSESRCPACDGLLGSVFFELNGVPAHSCLLMETREEAVAFPTGDIRLALCDQCGFIANTAFDPRLNRYSTQYEETQAYSAQFMGFARELAGRWVREHGLEGKRVLEIGCGKGEFLLEMVRAGAGPSIGIDPGIIPDRLQADGDNAITWIPDLFDERYVDLPADAVVCRHTLEHISPVARFLDVVHTQARQQFTKSVLFELPDALRVLREAAFWDIYYEHCSYFTPGSLARLFRRVGFTPTRLELAYTGQYILLESRMDARQCAHLEAEEPVPVVQEAVTRFTAAYQRQVCHWRGVLDGCRRTDRNVVIWGGGSKGVSFLSTLDQDGFIRAAVDINPRKWGKFMAGTGHPVVGPEALQSISPDLVLVMNPIYMDEVAAELRRVGVSAELQAVQ